MMTPPTNPTRRSLVVRRGIGDVVLTPTITWRSALATSAHTGRSAPSDVDDLDSTPGGSGELLDITAVGRDHYRATTNGRLDHRRVDRTDGIGNRSTKHPSALGMISGERFDLAAIEEPGQVGLTTPTPRLDNTTSRHDRQNTTLHRSRMKCPHPSIVPLRSDQSARVVHDTERQTPSATRSH
jgi:hypothetical protein